MLLKTLKLLRKHPKKSIFFGSIFGFALNFVNKKYQEECLMRSYCEEAIKYGNVCQRLNEEDRHITVILNPAAGNGKGKSKYDKYCAPLLHLAGLKVALVKTEHEDQAKQIMGIMDNTSAVIVAGGDGTFSEILTGLLRREDAKSASRRFPLGILPLGETNTTASSIWKFSRVPEVKHLAEATMAIIRNWTRKLDLMEITPLDESADDPKKPVYASSHLDWGAFRDARERTSDYWYWAFFKKYMVYIFSTYKDLSWDCVADLEYLAPCTGCSTCIQKKEKEEIEAFQKRPRRWWEAFIPRPKNGCIQEKEQVDYSSIFNEDCGRPSYSTLSRVSDVRIVSNNTPSTRDRAGHFLTLFLGKKNLTSGEFIQEGWRRERMEPPSHDTEIRFGELILRPSVGIRKDKDDKDRYFNIDSEPFEVRTMKIRPKPNAVTVFAPPQTIPAPC